VSARGRPHRVIRIIPFIAGRLMASVEHPPARRITVGEALIGLLEQADVTHVFGIPGVHTIELYRGLAASNIRHVTPRHEQGAGFMADGFARASGKPGVCLLITGPGLTNAVTAMAQALAESVPLFVITGVNARATLGLGRGHLHELPDQAELAAQAAKASFTVLVPDDLGPIFSKAWHTMLEGRRGPVHFEIPTDVMGALIDQPAFTLPGDERAAPDPGALQTAADRINNAALPVILAGGGAVTAAAEVRRLAEMIDAPVVQTVNARGLLNTPGRPAHPLAVPASPSLKAVRALIAQSDCVIAIGTEFGPTDYDMYETGTMPEFQSLIRIDRDQRQLARRSGLAENQSMICADATESLSRLIPLVAPASRNAGALAAATFAAARDEIGPRYRALADLCSLIWQAVPGAIIAGDSTQPVYAGNLCLDAPHPSAWFNSATGFGTLGHALPAAIGASVARPGPPVICLAGDGGLQFTLAEIGTAADERANVIIIVWNNRGYQEIESSMVAAGITPCGVRPTPPDFHLIAQAWGMPSFQPRSAAALADCLVTAQRPCLLVLDEGDFLPGGRVTL
jgi:acetolactate synthase I/II/III large subunit